MKDYLPIIERLFISIAFFAFGWFFCQSRHEPIQKSVDVVYKHDTVRTVQFVEKQKVIHKYINKVDSYKVVIKDTVLINDSTKSIFKDAIIALQDTVITEQGDQIDTLLKINKEYLNDIDTCYVNNSLISKQNTDLQKQVKKDHINKAILGGVGVILAGVLSYFIF